MSDKLSIIATEGKVTLQRGADRIELNPNQVEEVITDLRRLAVVALIMQGGQSEIGVMVFELNNFGWRWTPQVGNHERGRWSNIEQETYNIQGAYRKTTRLLYTRVFQNSQGENSNVSESN